MLTILLLAAALAPSVPQSPIVAGPFSSMGEVLAATRDCHLGSLRTETYDVDPANRAGFGEVRLYLLDDAAPEAKRCITVWQTQNGKRLGLAPRWYRDDFTKDAP